MPEITFTEHSKLKRSPKDSTTLDTADYLPVKPGKKLLITDHELAENNNVKLHLAGTSWGDVAYVYLPHVEGIEGNVEGNQPNDVSTPRPEDRGKLFNIPGIGKVHANDPILGSGGHFYYYEAFRPDGHRIPDSAELGQDVKRGAETMEWVRAELGELPIVVTSWHRPYSVNRRVGGSSRSQHLLSCSSVDFYPVGMSVEQAYRILDPLWGSQGGLARRPGSFIHIDRRGYRARWTY